MKLLALSHPGLQQQHFISVFYYSSGSSYCSCGGHPVCMQQLCLQLMQQYQFETCELTVLLVTTGPPSEVLSNSVRHSIPSFLSRSVLQQLQKCCKTCASFQTGVEGWNEKKEKESIVCEVKMILRRCIERHLIDSLLYIERHCITELKG